MILRAVIWLAGCFGLGYAVAADEPPSPPTMATVLAAANDQDWRTPSAENLLVLQLDAEREVVIELAPTFAEHHVANIRQLVTNRYFDGLAIIRSQDNYVVQWGDPAPDPEQAKAFGDRVEANLTAEMSLPDVLEFAALPDPDPYAERVGYYRGMPIGSDGQRTWLAHCYGMVGAGRGMDRDSGNGAQLYVVIGHAPRHLDRNVTLVGRVLQGMQYLSTLPRGTGALGFYEDPSEHVRIESVHLASELPQAQRPKLQVFRTDTPRFKQLIEARRHRLETWFVDPAGRIGLCNVPIPVREQPAQ